MTKTNKTSAALVAALALVMGSAIASAQMAPPASSQSPALNGSSAQTTMPQAKEIRGTIKSVDPSKKSITLDNGTKLMIPASAAAEADTLKPGARVSAKYEEKGGEKVVTSLQVEPASKS
jgi:Cu/Ag efflux protein CusF